MEIQYNTIKTTPIVNKDGKKPMDHLKTQPKPHWQQNPRPNNKMFNHRINHMIRSPEVRVVYESDKGENITEVLSLSNALDLSLKQGVDLVEISPKSNPPVCKLMDYGKFLYREQKNHKRDKQTKSKEIGCHVNIAENDLHTKLRHAEDFLANGNQVIFKVQFRGREAAHKEIGVELLKTIQEKLEVAGTAEGTPKVNGKLAMLRFSPKKQNLTNKHLNGQ
jgi:translation initiation factor IF-3